VPSCPGFRNPLICTCWARTSLGFHHYGIDHPGLSPTGLSPRGLADHVAVPPPGTTHSWEAPDHFPTSFLMTGLVPPGALPAGPVSSMRSNWDQGHSGCCSRDFAPRASSFVPCPPGLHTPVLLPSYFRLNRACQPHWALMGVGHVWTSNNQAFHQHFSHKGSVPCAWCGRGFAHHTRSHGLGPTRAFSRDSVTCHSFLLLRWGETMSLWNWASNVTIVHHLDDSWMVLTGETRRTWRETCPSATLFTTNPNGLPRREKGSPWWETDD
jgi:hypothetical protein